MWGTVDQLIRHPPLWGVLIVFAILVSHALKDAIRLATDRPRPNALIISLELMVVFVLSYLSIHLYYEKFIGETKSVSWHEEPLLMVGLLVFFTIVSMVIYVFFKAQTDEEPDPDK
jgi:hypothetical protein